MKSLSILVMAYSLAIATSGFGAITTYISGPGVVSAELTDPVFSAVTTVSFNSASTGQVDAGGGITVGTATYSGTGNVFPNDQYGGNDGNYLAIAANQTVTIDFSSPIRYFGLFFTAGDRYNTFELKSGGVTISSFTTQDVLDIIPNTPGHTITTIGGDTYNTQDYYGQPGTGLNANQPYAYIHIFGDLLTSFDQVILTQGAGSTFDSDNHSWSTALITPPNPVVPFIPEPSSLILTMSCLGMAAFRRKR